MSQANLKAELFRYDYWSLAIVIALLCLGLIMVASASMVISDRTFNSPFHFLLHQITYLGIGIFLATIAIRIPLLFWEKTGPYFLLGSLFLLILVLVPGVGKEINGSMRWLGFSSFGIQVSELAKFSLIVYLAGYLLRRQNEVYKDFRGFLKPMLLLGLMGILLLLEPDFGAVAVLTLTALGVIFLAGARLWQFILLMFSVAVGMMILAITSPYRMLRLTTFLHPWAAAYGSGYQLTQSLIAFGRGGIFGVGLGNSIQKLFYLPEAHTDFLFAVLAEELGLIGELVVLGLFLTLVIRILVIGRMAIKKDNFFAAYLAYGFGFWIGLQALINIGVNSGVLPTKGLTLPFMSYGGSSMIFYCLAVALLMRVYHEVSV